MSIDIESEPEVLFVYMLTTLVCKSGMSCFSVHHLCLAMISHNACLHVHHSFLAMFSHNGIRSKSYLVIAACFKHSLCPAQCTRRKPFAAQVQCFRMRRMSLAAEDMTLDDFNRVCDGMVCRALASPFTCHEPNGTFHHLNFPMVELENAECNP